MAGWPADSPSRATAEITRVHANPLGKAPTPTRRSARTAVESSPSRPVRSRALVPVLVLGAALAVAAIALRPSDRPSVSATRANPSPLEVTLGAQDDELLLRVESEQPVALRIDWADASGSHGRELTPAIQHAIDVSAGELAGAESLAVRTSDGRRVDLESVSESHLEALRAALERLDIDRIASRLNQLFRRGSAPDQMSNALRSLLPPGLSAQIRRTAPIARHWLRTGRDRSRRSALLRAIYRAETLEQLVMISRAHGSFGCRSLLPTPWREAGFQPDDPRNPRFDARLTGRALPDLGVTIDGVPSRDQQAGTIGPGGTYAPVRLAVSCERTKQRLDLGQIGIGGSSREPVAQKRTWTFSIDLAPHPLGEPRTLVVGLHGRSTGATALWVDLNGALEVPFFLGGHEPGQPRRDNAEWFRGVPADLLHVGRNTITIAARPLAGLDEIASIWAWWLILLPSP
jgi:hypothetical protein